MTAARLSIPPGDLSSSLVIPLQVLPLPGGGESQGYKLGINVTLTNPETGKSVGPILYELDTGAAGFFASIPSGDDFPIPAKTYGEVFAEYASGIAPGRPAHVEIRSVAGRGVLADVRLRQPNRDPARLRRRANRRREPGDRRVEE